MEKGKKENTVRTQAPGWREESVREAWTYGGFPGGVWVVMAAACFCGGCGRLLITPGRAMGVSNDA